MVLSNPIFVVEKRSQRSTNTFSSFLGTSRGGLAIVFCSWNVMIDPIWNNFSHRERNLKSCCPPPPKHFFFYCWNSFWERPMSPRTNGKRENFIYYTWKTFFKATRQKGRSNTDIYKIFQRILQILRQCFVLTFQSKSQSIVSRFINKTV